MAHDTFHLHPIGTIRTPFQTVAGTPVQAQFSAAAVGSVEVAPAYAAALDDIEGFDRVWLIYWMDRAGTFRPRVVPYLDTREHGVFATRVPSRPNPLGMTAVRLLGRLGNTLRVGGIDVLDGTPLLDIKPYVPAFDAHPGLRAGWYDDRQGGTEVADDRFHRRD